jgi:hypothetical protein
LIRGRTANLSVFEDIPHASKACYKNSVIKLDTAGSNMQGQIAGARFQRAILSFCLLTATLLQGCGGGGGSGAISNEPPSSGSPSAPPSGGGDGATSSVTLYWNPPTENTDGSALTNLAGYRIDYGTAPTELTRSISVPSASTLRYVVEGLSAGTWYFAVTVRNSTGAESTRSNTASRILP